MSRSFGSTDRTFQGLLAAVAKLSCHGSNIYFHLSDLHNNEIIRYKAPSGDLIDLSTLDDYTDKENNGQYSLQGRQCSSGKGGTVISYYVSSVIFMNLFNLPNNPLRNKLTFIEHLLLTASVLDSVCTCDLESPQQPFPVGFIISILQIWKLK